MTAAGLPGGLATLADRYDAFLVVADGVLHEGERLRAGAAQALQDLAARGRAVMVLTNRPERTAAEISRLEGLGLSRHSFTTVVSAGEAMWHVLRTGALGPPFGGGRRVHRIGTPAEDDGLHDLDLTLVGHPAAADFLLLTGPAPAGLEHLQHDLAPAAGQHIPALCLDPARHPDAAASPHPAPGDVAALYASLGGRVRFVGLPHAPLFAGARKAAGSSVHRFLCLCGSLAEVAGAAEAGCDTALVLAGPASEADERDIEGAPHRPSFVLPGLAG